jgi:hypothetical protein
VVANVDGEDRVEPTVEQTFLRFQAARAREEAVRRADEGDFTAVASQLREAASALLPYAGAPEMVEEIEDLQAEAAKMDERKYEARDRKYQGARAMASWNMKTDYSRKISRGGAAERDFLAPLLCFPIC